KPEQGQSGGSGKDAATSGDMEDDFEFTMREEEILDIFFEDLELPNLVRTALSDVQLSTWKRSGLSTAGAPNQINILRTMRNSFGRGPGSGGPPSPAAKHWKGQTRTRHPRKPVTRRLRRTPRPARGAPARRGK